MHHPSRRSQASPEATERARGEIILVVDDTPANLRLLRDILVKEGYQVRPAPSGGQALRAVASQLPDLVLLDIMMPEMDGFEVCRRLKESGRTADIPVLFISAVASTEEKVRAFQTGAVDYVPKPFQPEEVLARVRAHLLLRQLQRELVQKNAELEERVAERTAEIERLRHMLEIENGFLRQEVREAQAPGDILGHSQALSRVLEQIDLVARTDASVLITGESGTGKELVAREIHRRSLRVEGPLIKVNCAAVPHELFESEFFGHKKGAFTGAIKDRAGRFLAADHGTLFLDEVGEIPLAMQSKLLRVLQESEFEPVGDERTQRVSVRIIAATNRNLAQESESGRFRQDLYFRLNVFPVEMPPLRARNEDIPLLAEHFLGHAAKRHGLPAPRLTDEHLKQLTGYDWPGNVRELASVIERTVITSRHGQLTFFLPRRSIEPAVRPAASIPKQADPQAVVAEPERRQLDRDNLLLALRKTGWKISGPGSAAELLGVNPNTLASRIKRLGLKRTLE